MSEEVTIKRAGEMLQQFAIGKSIGTNISAEDDAALLVASMIYAAATQLERIADQLDSVIGEVFADVVHVKAVQ